MHDNFRDFLKQVEPIRLKDPLAETLGAFREKGVILEYSFIETIKMAGHACPTVSAAFLACKKALESLYPGEVPVRGDIAITVYGDADETVYGVMAQVFSLITGACPSTGFKGLGRKFRRKDLLKFNSKKVAADAMCFEFRRLDNNISVMVKICPHKMPSLGEKEHRIGELLEKILWEAAKEHEIAEFQNLWMEKVKRLALEEEGIEEWLGVEKR